MKIYNGIDELIGKTPLVRLSHIERKYGLDCKLLAKLEYFNPAGSAKDRVALFMIDGALSRKEINENTVIIEPTSGNTGIGLAAVAAAKGYRAIIVMPDNMSRERIVIMRAYGAEVVLTPAAEGMSGAIKKARALADEIPNSFIPLQFDNPDNKRAHFETTGPEIYADTDGDVDIFVAGVGTGGTITGIGEYLKGKKKDVRIIAVEPADSPVLSGGKPHPHALQGIGAGFIPTILNTEIYDEVIGISKDDAYALAREIAALEGIAVGISSGAALAGALAVARRSDSKNKTVVVLLPDGADRYLSTDLF